MVRNIWVINCLCAGIALCVFKNAAFAAIGVILGLVGISIGVYLLCSYYFRREYSVILGITLIVVGLLLIILCIFVEYVAYFLGGVVLIAAGIILLPTCSHHHWLITYFCIGCLVLGIIIIFTASFLPWMSVFVGILLIVFSGLLAIYMN